MIYAVGRVWFLNMAKTLLFAAFISLLVVYQIYGFENNEQKTVLVMFFPYPNVTGNQTITDENIEHLNLTKRALIQPYCSQKTKYPEGTLFFSTAVGEELFKKNLADLLNYSRNVLDFSTAVSTHSESTAFKHSFRVFDMKSPQRIQTFPFRRNTENDFLDDLDLPDLVPYEDNDHIPTYHAFPKNNPRFNNIDKWTNNQRNRPAIENFDEFKSLLEKEGTNPKVKPKSIWDISSVTSVFKNLLFNKFLKPKLDARKEARNVGFNTFGPSLFDSVKTTIDNMEFNKNGFVVVIIGGNMADINAPNSDLMKSIRFVSESIDNARSHLVLSPYCLTREEGAQNGVQKRENLKLPILARGPRADLLTKAKKVEEVPTIAKHLLEEIYGEKNKKNDKDYLKYQLIAENIKNTTKEPRNKRHVFTITKGDNTIHSIICAVNGVQRIQHKLAALFLSALTYLL